MNNKLRTVYKILKDILKHFYQLGSNKYTPILETRGLPRRIKY